MFLLAFNNQRFEGAAFYSLGMLISNHGYLDRLEKTKDTKMIFVISLALFLLYSTNQVCQFMSFPMVMGNFFGIIFYWMTYDYLYNAFHGYNTLKKVAKFSFFIYCAHEPAFNIIKKLSIMLVGESEATYTILYFANPIVFLLILILCAFYMERHLSPVYRLLAGNR